MIASTTMEFAINASQTGDTTNTTEFQSTTKSLLQHSQQQHLQQRGKLSISVTLRQSDQKKSIENVKANEILELKKNTRINKWLILDFIGKGAFGCVYKVCSSSSFKYFD